MVRGSSHFPITDLSLYFYNRPVPLFFYFSTAWLTVNNPTIAQSGDQFRCIASNRTRPDATSDPAQLTVLPPPANDNFAAAILLSGTSVRVTGSNNNAGKEAGEPNHAYNIGGHSV